jgi:hypothetical protein
MSNNFAELEMKRTSYVFNQAFLNQGGWALR